MKTKFSYDFGMQSPRQHNGDDCNNKIAQEIVYNVRALQHQVAESFPQLIPEQNHIFH